MAKLDFPGSPTPSQKYPSPAVAGQPVYTWDGEKWASIASQYVPGTAPFENAMAYSGMQINGGMEVSQERGTGVTSLGGYICDGWMQNYTGTMSMQTGQVASGGPAGFPYCLASAALTAQSTLGANDYDIIWQQIEGYRTARLAWGTASAQPITISFWSWHHRTGLYSGSVRNPGLFNRSYTFTYTQAAADVPQYNTVTIPGDVTGTWQTGNGGGMALTFSNGAGTTFTATSANTWLAGNYQAAPGQVNGVAATSDIFRITGVTVLPGTQAPTAAQSPNIMRPYDQELVTCQRYLQLYASVVVGTSSSYVSYLLPCSMRALPTVTGSAPGFAAAPHLGHFDCWATARGYSDIVLDARL